MLARSPWGPLYERDLDLVLLDLLYSNASFRRQLLATIAPDVRNDPEADFIGAWHSVIDDLGHESDIEAEWRTPVGTFTLLIEDKLGARCQPEQALRYLARAARYRESGRSAVTRTLLVAPAEYPARHAEDTAPFEAYLAIEQIGAWTDAGSNGGRGVYLTRMLQHAIDRVTRTHTTRSSTSSSPTRIDGRTAAGDVADDGPSAAKVAMVPIYAILREVLAQLGSNLTITSSGTWVYFTFPERRTNVMLRYRLTDGWAELSFVKKTIPEERVVQVFRANPLNGGDVSTRGKTETAIWMPTPELDLEAGVAGQRDRVLAACGVVETLRRWYMQHADTLHSTGEVMSTDHTQRAGATRPD